MTSPRCTATEGAAVRGVLRRLRAIAARLRARAWSFCLQFECGRSVGFGPGVTVNLDPGARLIVGADTYVASGVYLHVAHGATLRIGSDSFIGNNCVIMAKQEISIGDGAAIAEHVSIRDHDHVLGQRPLTGGLDVAPVHVGDDVWLASKATVTRGVAVGNGAVVAAGAVVTRDVVARTIVAGVPARLIRQLT